MDFSKFKTLLFDLDGTLIDSTADLAASGNYIRVEAGMDALSEEKVAGYIGNGVHVLVQRLLETEDAAVIDSAVEKFIRHYHVHCLDKTCLYPGTRDLLEACAARGLRTSTGLGMLVHQGALSFALFTGHAVEARRLRAVLEGGDGD